MTASRILLTRAMAAADAWNTGLLLAANVANVPMRCERSGSERSDAVWRGGRHKKVPAPADVSVEGAAPAVRARAGRPRARLQTVESDSPGQAAVRARLHKFESPMLSVLCAELNLKILMKAPKDQKVELLMTKHEDLQRAWESSEISAAAAAASPAAAAAAAAGASLPAAASAAAANLAARPPPAARDSDPVTPQTPMPDALPAVTQLRPAPPTSPALPADPATASAVGKAQKFLAQGAEHRMRRRWGEACESFTAGLDVLGVGARIHVGAATEEELRLDTQLRMDWAQAALRACEGLCTAAVEDSQSSRNKRETAARQSAELAREAVEHCSTVLRRGPSSDGRALLLRALASAELVAITRVFSKVSSVRAAAAKAAAAIALLDDQGAATAASTLPKKVTVAYAANVAARLLKYAANDVLGAQRVAPTDADVYEALRLLRSQEGWEAQNRWLRMPECESVDQRFNGVSAYDASLCFFTLAGEDPDAYLYGLAAPVPPRCLAAAPPEPPTVTVVHPSPTTPTPARAADGTDPVVLAPTTPPPPSPPPPAAPGPAQPAVQAAEGAVVQVSRPLLPNPPPRSLFM